MTGVETSIFSRSAALSLAARRKPMTSFLPPGRRPRAFTAGNPRGGHAKIRGKPSAKFRMSSSLDLQ
jgi:hypothetical protein